MHFFKRKLYATYNRNAKSYEKSIKIWNSIKVNFTLFKLPDATITSQKNLCDQEVINLENFGAYRLWVSLPPKTKKRTYLLFLYSTPEISEKLTICKLKYLKYKSCFNKELA